MANALLAAVRDRVSLVRALLETEAIPTLRLEEELARTAPDTPVLRHPVPVMDLVARLPPDLCSALVAVPVRADTLTGTIDVAVADASDAHAAEEISFYLSAPVRILRSPLGAIESAIAQARHESSYPPTTGPISVPPPSPVRPMAHTPPWGSPAYLGPVPSAVEEHAHTLSERPMPLIPKTQSERMGEHLPERASNGFPDGAAERSAARSMPDAEIAIPLSRRLTPGRGLVALARAAQELEDEEDPVVELRRAKSSTPPEVVAPEPEPPPEPPRAAPEPEPSPESERESGPDFGPISLTNRTNGVSSRLLPTEERREDEPPLSYSHMPLSQILREMARAATRDRLMELVLIAVHPLAPKSALFAVKKEAYVGWMCTSDFGEGDPLAHVQIDARKPSLLSTTATVGTYMGPMPRNDVHAPLAKFVRSYQPQQLEVLGVAIKAGGRPVVLLIAHEVQEPLRAMTVLTEVARVAGETLERILRAKR
jgi:hypothetical protein